MIGKITTVSTSAQVAYLKTEYLAKGADAEKQEFLGKGAAALGLGIQTTQAINHLCEGRDPATGRLLVESGRNGQRRAGYEFALSPDKTVSLAYAFGDSDTQRTIKECHNAAVARAVAEVERLTDTRRTENGKREREPVAGIVVAKFDHYASREGEPQLHSHCLLFNLATGRDGALAAITTERLMASKEIVGQIYQMALFEELAAKGIAAEKRETHPSETSREVFTAAVIPALELYALEYSTRREQIVAAVKREGSAVAAQAAALKTRKAKNEPPLAELKTQWKKSAPLTENEIRAAILGKAILTKEKQPTVDDLIKRLVEKTATEKSILTEADIGKHIAKNLAKHITANEIQTATEQAMASPLLIAGGKGPEGQRRFVSTAVLKMEAAMMSRMDEMTAGQFSVSITKEIGRPVLHLAKENGIVLSKEQIGATNHILTGGRLVTIEGAAGAGKTTIMRFVADLYAAAGCEIIGCSKAASAAKKLGDDAGIEAGTIDKLNQSLDSGKRRLTNKSVVVIDEAGMLDTTPAAKLIAHAHAAGAKVIMVGDRKQLQPIGQGGAFTHAATLGNGAFLMIENRRQESAADKAAALILRNGTKSQIQGLFDKLEKDGRLVIKPTIDATAKQAAHDYYKDAANFQDKILLAENNAVVSLLNDQVQQHRIANGEIGTGRIMRLAPTAEKIDGKEVPIHEDVQIGLGDRIRFCKNSGKDAAIIDPQTGKKSAVLNGNLGTVEGIKKDGEAWLITARLDDGKKVAFRSDHYDRIALGYASTVHKSQGQSVTASFDVSLNPSRHSNYVAGTRHKKRSITYTTGEACQTLAAKSTREDYAELGSKVVAQARAEETMRKAAEAAKAMQATQPLTQERKTAPTPSQASTEATRPAATSAHDEAGKSLAEVRRRLNKGRGLGLSM